VDPKAPDMGKLATELSRIDTKTLVGIQSLIQKQEPVPGMFDFVTKLTKRVFMSEDAICKVFCQRHDIELPPPDFSLKERLGFLSGKVSLVRTAFNSDPSLDGGGEFIIQQSWCVDIRENPSNYAISWPMVVVLRKGTVFTVNIHDPDASPGLYDHLQGEF
jgi:hypothetical protein